MSVAEFHVSSVQHARVCRGDQPRTDVHTTGAQSSARVQHGPTHGLDFDDVGDTWPSWDVEHGAAYEDLDPRGFVS